MKAAVDIFLATLQNAREKQVAPMDASILTTECTSLLDNETGARYSGWRWRHPVRAK